MREFGTGKNRKQVKTRKEHQCTGCLESIPLGSAAVQHSGKSDGEYYRYYLHMECHQYLVKAKAHLMSDIWDGCVNDLKKQKEQEMIWE